MGNKKYIILGGILVLLLIVAAVLFFTSGNSGPRPTTDKVQLTWWKTFEDSENIQELLTEYQKVNKNVTINFVKKDIATYEQELINAIAAGTGPDIFSIHNDWLPKHSDKMIAMPPSMMSLRTYKETFIDVAYSDFVKEEQIYAIPLATDVLALFYNKDLIGSAGISQPPSTWPELSAAVQQITKVAAGGSFSRSGVAMGTSSNVNRAVDVLALLMLQQGTKFYSDDLSSATFDRDQDIPGSNQNFNPGETALQFYTQFAQPSKTTYNWNTKSDFSVDAFTQGKVAMMINYSYMIPSIQDRAPNLNWDVAPIPQISETALKVNFANYWGEGVSKSSKNAVTAWDFLKFISSKESLEKYYAQHKLVSSRKDILPNQVSDTEIGAFAEGALTARSVYKPDASLFESIFLNMIDDVILRNTEADEALRSAVQQINLNLQRR
jgi:multiple sugar transport system substrate-binding protein